MIPRSLLLLLAAVSGCHLIGGIDSAELECSNDGLKNGVETDVDCGGKCTPCADGKVCARHEDCASNACDLDDVEFDGTLKCLPPSCDDTRVNGYETDVDCGGEPDGDCERCWGGERCKVDEDCVSAALDPSMRNDKPACQDGLCFPYLDCYADCPDTSCDEVPCNTGLLGAPCMESEDDWGTCVYPLWCTDGEDFDLQCF